MAIWLALSFFLDIPQEIYESAEIDGCSEFKMYTRIALPLVKAGLVLLPFASSDTATPQPERLPVSIIPQHTAARR